MSQFLGTHQNRLDAKGRISVPASFRAALRGPEGGPVAIIVRPHQKHACIDAWPQEAFETMATSVNKLDFFNDDADDLITALYADAFAAEADKEGRILLPDSLVKYANLTDSAVFMGLGRSFQIWEPEAARQRTAQARENARARRLTLPASSPAAAPAGTAA